MDEYEQSVLRCLTANGETFVSNEYPVEGGWSRPDFVALRPAKKTVYIVEVSAGGNLYGLVKKVVTRKKQWTAKLGSQLLRLKLVSSLTRTSDGSLEVGRKGMDTKLLIRDGRPKALSRSLEKCYQLRAFVLGVVHPLAHWIMFDRGNRLLLGQR